MTVDLEHALLNTTLMSSLQTHQRLKDLKEVFGCSEDIVSRLAISLSMRAGAMPLAWEPQTIQSGLTVLNGKSIRGKTLFKSELPLFLVMLAVAEPQCPPERVREMFQLHWERGVEMMSNELGNGDWLEYLAATVQQATK
jgi:hypothetical protein